MEKSDLQKKILDIRNDLVTLSFDRFIIGKMLPQSRLEQIIPEEIRLQAYHIFMQRVEDAKVAAPQTIQHWFGIQGSGRPTREMVFRLGFALRLSTEEVEEYLKKGIRQPGIQMCDYREVIYYYGMYHNYTLEQAYHMIDRFEQRMPLETEVIHSKYTWQLCKIFQEKREWAEDDYLEWMLQHGAHLKGYSMTVLDYLQSFRKEILEGIVDCAQQRMWELLRETGYFLWEEKRHLPSANRVKSIRYYLKNREKITGERIADDLADCIIELLDISQLSVQANEKMLMELYASAWEKNRISDVIRKKVSSQLHFSLMDQKYLSELFTVGAQRDRQMNLLRLQRQLQQASSPNHRCPSELWKRAKELGYTGQGRDISEVSAWAKDAVTRQSRRCRMIQREDMLTLVFYLAQIRYICQLEETGEFYTPEMGRKILVELADTTLTACNMEKFNTEHYLLDAILWECYQQDEMYSFSDLIEVLQ